MGVWGYKVPKSMNLYEAPSFSIKKDMSSFFDIETRHLKQNPGPGQYNLMPVMTKEEEKELMKKRRQKIDPAKVPKRPNFLDEDLQRAKGYPSPGQYSPKILKSGQGNLEMKIDRLSYLAEAISNNKNSIPPGHYKVKVTQFNDIFLERLG